MRNLIRGCSLLMAVLIALGLGTAQASNEYRLIDLGTLGGRESHAYSINNRGQVVGDAINAAGASHAFLWDKGVMTDLGTLTGGGGSAATAINDRGQVVGLSTIATGEVRAFLWEKGVMTDLGTLTGVGNSAARGINNRGQVVGWSNTATDAGHAFLWENGHMIDLGALEDGNTMANAINDAGDVVGSAWLANQDVNRGFLWKNGVMTVLEPLPGDSDGWASSINNRGQAVGGMLVSGSGTSAVLWSAGKISGLTTEQSWANDINDRSQVVGRSQPSRTSGTTHVCVWDKGHCSILPIAGDLYGEGMSINNHGMVVGWALNAGQTHAVLWLPTQDS
jgi:probable HAF family extracellular repeat protein